MEHPTEQFTATAPRLQQLTDQLASVLQPGMLTEHDDGTGYTTTAWFTVKALTFLLKATTGGDDHDENLEEVSTCLMQAAGHARRGRAAATPLPDLTAAVEQAAAAADGPQATQLRLVVVDPATDDLDTLDVDGEDAGGLTVRSGKYGWWPVSGPLHLDLAALLNLAGQVYVTAARQNVAVQ